MAIVVPTRTPASLGSTKSDAVASTDETTELLADQYNVCADKLIDVINQSNTNETNIGTNATGVGNNASAISLLDGRVTALEGAPSTALNVTGSGGSPTINPCTELEFLDGTVNDAGGGKATYLPPPPTGANDFPLGFYNYTNAAGDPTSGQIRSTGATTATVSELRIHYADSRSLDHEQMWSRLSYGDSIVLLDRSDTSRSARFTVIGAPEHDAAGFVSIPVGEGQESSAGFLYPASASWDVQVIPVSPPVIAAGVVILNGTASPGFEGFGLSNIQAGQFLQVDLDYVFPDNDFVVSLNYSVAGPMPRLSARSPGQLQIDFDLSVDLTPLAASGLSGELDIVVYRFG